MPWEAKSQALLEAATWATTTSRGSRLLGSLGGVARQEQQCEPRTGARHRHQGQRRSAKHTRVRVPLARYDHQSVRKGALLTSSSVRVQWRSRQSRMMLGVSCGSKCRPSSARSPCSNLSQAGTHSVSLQSRPCPSGTMTHFPSLQSLLGG